MAKILVIMPRAPYPPRADGVTIRFNPIFEYLCSRHQLDLIIACDPRPDAHIRADEARAKCQSLVEFDLPQTHMFLRKLRILKGLLTPGRAPYKILREWSVELAKLVNDRVSQASYDVVLWTGFPDAASIFLASNIHRRTRVVFDWVDSSSLGFDRMQRESNGGHLTIFDKYRLWKWKRWERSLNQHLDAAMYITETDSGYANPPGSANIHVLPNGIYDDIPADIKQHTKEQGSATIGFLGNMGYLPNIQAALRLYRIFLSLLSEIPSLKLKIIGREPAAAISELASNNVEVTGSVESIWPDIYDTDIFVFPMTIGTGLQNKVLEVLRAGKAVVTSEVCAFGLVNKGQGVVITANSDEEFRQNILHLLRSDEFRRRYEENSCEFIKQYDWRNILPRYERTLLTSS
jgi:glycosyltransferase involved in cell wall biosynthesis